MRVLRCDAGVRPGASGPSDLSDAALKAALDAAKVDPSVTRRPSVETVLHALALTEAWRQVRGPHAPRRGQRPDVLRGHAARPSPAASSPTRSWSAGRRPLISPTPIRGCPWRAPCAPRIQRYTDEWRQPPKVVLMQNHGLIALGASAREVDSITAMYVKTCRVLAGAYAFGGPHFMTAENVRAHPHAAGRSAIAARQLGIA